MTLIDNIVNNVLKETLNRPSNFMISYTVCNKCGKKFNTMKGALIHYSKVHKKKSVSTKK
jgi:hypothetical protein